MELTEELVRKHAKMIEARVTVKAHTAHSKKGKVFNVKQHERELTPRQKEQIKFASIKQLQMYSKDSANPAFAAGAKAELGRRSKGIGGFASNKAKHENKMGSHPHGMSPRPREIQKKYGSASAKKKEAEKEFGPLAVHGIDFASMTPAMFRKWQKGMREG